MLGVVVWSSQAQKKAVIWCEDQGALAYLGGQEDLADGHAWPEPGDMLDLQSELIDGLRHARKVQLVQSQACPTLPDELRNAKPAATHLRLVSQKAKPVIRRKEGRFADGLYATLLRAVNS